MGIRGLTGWIRWAAPSAMAAPDWGTLTGKKVGIDILGFLYKAKAQRRSPFLFVAQCVAACKRHGIIPIPVFDGKPPDAKRQAIEARASVKAASAAKQEALSTDLSTVPMSPGQRKLVEREFLLAASTASYFTPEERDAVKQLLYACGVMFLNAAGEADTVLAYFARREEFAAVISNDMDFLARGVQTLLVPEAFALPGDSSGWIQYNLSEILTAVQFSYEQFLQMCILMGCDYTVGSFSLPYKSAYWAIKYRGNIALTIKQYKIADIDPYVRAYRILSGLDDTAEGLMNEKQWDKFAAGPPPIELETLYEFQKLLFPSLHERDYTLLQR